MRSQRQLATLVASGTAAAVLLSGCAASSGGDGDEVTITYWENLIDDGGVQDEVIAAFEESHPGVIVNRVTMQVEDLSVKLPSALGAPSGPNLIYGDVSPRFLGEYVKSDRILALGDAYADRGWNDRVYPWAKERASYDDEVYAVGHELEDLGLMVNTKIFDELGISLPENFADLEAAMSTIADESDYTPMTLACGGGCYNGFHVMHDIAYGTMPTEVVVSTTPQGDGAYTDPGWLDALETFQDWSEQGWFTAGANGIDFDNHWASFCAGQTAMLTQGTWLFNTIEDCAEQSGGALEWVNIPFPVADGLPFQAYVGIGSGWYAPSTLEADPAKLEAVLDLIDMFIAEDTANEWVTKAQIFPVVPFDQTNVELTPAQIVSMDIATRAGDNGGPVPVGFNNSAKESEIWAAGLQGIVDGSRTPQQLIEELQAELEESQSDWKA